MYGNHPFLPKPIKLQVFAAVHHMRIKLCLICIWLRFILYKFNNLSAYKYFTCALTISCITLGIREGRPDHFLLVMLFNRYFGTCALDFKFIHRILLHYFKWFLVDMSYSSEHSNLAAVCLPFDVRVPPKEPRSRPVFSFFNWFTISLDYFADPSGKVVFSLV